MSIGLPWHIKLHKDLASPHLLKLEEAIGGGGCDGGVRVFLIRVFWCEIICCLCFMLYVFYLLFLF